MADESQPQSPADQLYAEGMSYNWRQDSLASAALSRANLERAAALGHLKAMRELAEMTFAGSGGPKNEEHALWLKWAAFVRGDLEALGELSALLGSYAETAASGEVRRRAAKAAEAADEASERLTAIGGFVQDMVHLKLPR